MSPNSRNQGFFYYFCLMIEGCGSAALLKILTFHCRENIFWKFISLTENWITWSQQELAKPQSQIPNIHFRKGNMLFHMLTAECLHLVLYLPPEYRSSRQNILILFLKYLFVIRSEATLSLFGNTQMENCLQCNAGNTVLAFFCNSVIKELVTGIGMIMPYLVTLLLEFLVNLF